MLREELQQVKAIAREIAKEETAVLAAVIRQVVRNEVAKALEKKTEQAAAPVPPAAPSKIQIKKSANPKTT